MTEREAAGELGLIQGFVNSVDLTEGREELDGPDALKLWLVSRGLLGADQPVDNTDLGHAVAVREAIRSVIGANSGQPIYPVELATLNEVAMQSGLRLRFLPEGRSRVEPEAGGVTAALGRLVAALDAAMRDPSWALLKLCGDPSCRWAFFDRSRNHSSRWCDMASCGNRQKARRFRTRSKAAVV